MATSSQEETISDRRLKFEDRALMVKFQLSPSLTISDEKIRDKLQIYFQKRKFGGGDVDKVIYPLEARSKSAIIVFSIQAEFDLGKLVSRQQVEISLPNDVIMTIDTTRLPQMIKIKEVKIIVDSLYLSIIPRGKEDQLEPMLKEVALATLEHTSPNPTVSVPTIENVQAVQDVVLSVTGLHSDDKNANAKIDGKENVHLQYHQNSYDAKKYETTDSSPGEVGSDIQYSVSADESVRPKEHPFPDHKSKPDNHPTENTNGEPPRFTSSYNRSRASSSSRMAASFSEGTDEEGRSSTSNKNDTTQELDGHSSDEHTLTSPKNMSSSSRPSAGPFTVNTILFKYLEDKCTGDMNNLRSRFGVDIICKAHNDQERQGNVYIVCDDKQATNRALCTDDEMKEAGEKFISLYQNYFQCLFISNIISCNGIGDKMIKEAKGVILNKIPLVMVEDSIDDEVTFVGKESEVGKAIKLFVQVTGLKTKSRKLKQNSESNIAYHPDNSSQNSSMDSSWKKIPQTSKDFEIITPEGIHVVVRKDDIVKQNVDVIVNAANSTLNHGMGVAGALRDAAGHGLQDESDSIKRSRGYIKDTDCVSTKGYNLPCRFVVHAVGPMYSSTIVTIRQKDHFFEKLERTFLNSFDLANTLQARSVAIPLISSGIFGAPKHACAKVLVDAIYEYSRNEKARFIDTMILVNRDDDATDAIQKAVGSRLQNDASSGNGMYGQLDDGGGRSGQTTVGVNFQGASASNWNYSSVGRNTVTYSLTDDDEYDKHFGKNDQHNHSKHNDQNGMQGREDIRTAIAKGKVEDDFDDSEEEDKKCPICLEDFAESKNPLKHLDKCKHKFCEECWDNAMKMKPACPVCGVLYGTITGNQPRGTMDVSHSSYPSLPGYERCGTIHINYNFPSGRQESNHPEPDAHYSGTRRTAYLPDNAEGNKVLALLRRAFEAKLTFTIGTSHTTGAKNTVTWNDIHHKTSTHGGTQAFGYPDPTYLTRVTEELAAKGIK